ncbi:MAG: c-type cytochrome [Bryobacterales bacterium]|nr:c-type cytochrome [Bryobacterales bacterium]
MKLLWALAPLLVTAQTISKPPVAPGRSIYLSNCSLCHGATGEGGRGPNLSSGTPVHGTTDADLRRVISKGVSGTPMPSFRFEGSEMAQLLGYLRSLRTTRVAVEKAPGDAASGHVIYEKLRCNACHRIDKSGSVYGPDLSRVGAGRSLAYLRESIVNPSADVPPVYRGVAVTAADGSRVTGIRVNEDSFSLQLRNIAQQFVLFDKSEIKEMGERKESLMPPYSNLTPKELDDLVSYLASLRGAITKQGVKKGVEVR